MVLITTSSAVSRSIGTSGREIDCWIYVPTRKVINLDLGVISPLLLAMGMVGLEVSCNGSSQFELTLVYSGCL